MKILLSSSTYHFHPDKGHYHSTGLTIEVFYRALSQFGEVDIIGDHESVEGRAYDLLVSWPRNYRFLVDHNVFNKKICFLNAAEPSYLKRVMLEEAGRLGCKLSDCFVFKGIQDADLYFMLGGSFNRARYVEAGIPNDKIKDFGYRPNERNIVHRDNKRPVFLHFATSLGLRKGFWWAVEDFKKANVDADLLCVGKVQKEKFWIDYASKANEHPNIHVIGWVGYRSADYYELMEKSDFLLFPTFGEGQAGTVVECMSYGVIPLTNQESGVPYFPLGEYKRGDPTIIQKAVSLSSSEIKDLKMDGAKELDNSYSNEYFINLAVQEIREILK